MTRNFTGWHFAAIIVTFFGVVIAVNVTMAVLAVRTFGGVVVENSYVASQEYNRWLADARRQEKLGWHVLISLDAHRHVIVSTDVAGASATGFARHPLGRTADIPLTFDRDLRSDRPLPPGRWAVHVFVRKDGREARFIGMVS
nr:FixH family protein [Sphingomonas sp.]